MIQNDGLCTLLAIILVMALLSGGMRERMRMGLSGPGVPFAPASRAPTPAAGADCGCNAGGGTAASARVATAAPATQDVPAAAEKAVSFESSHDSQSLDGIKRNLAESHKYRYDQSTCRQDFIGRTQGARTGYLHVMVDAENRGKNVPEKEFTSFQPYFGAPESRTNPTQYRDTVDLPLSESMFE